MATIMPSMATAQTANELASGFNNPPQESRPRVWWHWMDGNVNREGIRRDLLWMKSQGIAGFHQFDAGGINMPRAIKERLPYMSPEWKSVYHYAMSLADSLGMEVGIASAPGWSSTGGFWVKPEDAMKKLEWRSIVVRGGKTISVKMPDLYRTVGIYQDYYQPNDRVDVKPYGKDLYVIAVKIPEADLTMEEMGAEVDKSDSVITVKLAKEQTIKAITLKSMQLGGRSLGIKPAAWNFLETSYDGGRTWQLVSEIYPSYVPYSTIDITPTTSKLFRVRGKKLEGLTLHTVLRINHSQDQAAFNNPGDFTDYITPATSTPVSKQEVIDLTGKMAADGTLNCRLPRGKWRIYRFGWSITGKINSPASPDNTGLEVDKLDPDMWTAYFHQYFDMYKEASGGLLGSRGITRILIDSYEAGSQTWTPRMAEQFLQRRGYDLRPWLPVLTGEIIGSSDESMGFLFDWRRTIGELYAENYDRVDSIAREYGLLGRYTESHEGGRAYCVDGMDVKRHATNPMAAFWMQDTPAGSAVPSAISDIKESASVAHIYGQNSVSAESFSVAGGNRHAYTYCPENMKYIADVALSAGVTRFFIHESASQPNDAYLPGLQLFGYGQWFHRNETWAQQAHVLTDYLARSSYLLSRGRALADILLFYGEQNNITAIYGGSFSRLPQLPQGFEFDYASASVIRNEVEARDGALQTKTGMSYKIFWMDENSATMSLDILQRIKQFADAGVVICGPAPTRCAGLKADTAAFNRLVDDIWNTGRANVVSSISDAIHAAKLLPDLQADIESKADGTEGIRYVHRQVNDEAEIYWIRNFSRQDRTVNLSLRFGAPYATVLDPSTGRMLPVEVKKADGRYAISLPMLSTDALFVVFTAAPMTADEPLAVFKDSKHPDHPLTTMKEIDTPWQVYFSQKGGEEADATFAKLHSWTEEDNSVVKYYSGTAVYTTTFRLKRDDVKGTEPIYLDLGEVKNLAEISINGTALRTEWKAPFRTDDIRPMLHKGDNKLEIKVTNLWPNRQIGDVQKGEKHPVTSIRRFYRASDPLLPSGLLGPVRLMK